jgi:hypothetical protein
MLSQREIFMARSGHDVSEGRMYLSREDDTFLVDIVEIESGLFERSIRLLRNVQGPAAPILAGLVCCGGRYLLGYDPHQSFFTAYNLAENISICSLWLDEPGSAERARSATAPSPVVRSICSSRERDGMFFFSRLGESHLYAILVGDNGGCISKPIKLDGGFSKLEAELPQPTDSGASKLSSIASLCAHPTKPYLFVSLTSGCVQVWNYLGLKKAILKGDGADLVISREQSSSQLDEDEEEEEEEDESDGSRSDAGGSEKQGARSVASKKSLASSVLSSVFGRSQRKKQKESWQGMLPFALLVPPKLNASSTGAAASSLSATSVSFDSTGILVAVVWQDSTRGVGTATVYNALLATTKSPPVVTTGFFGSTTKVPDSSLVFPLSSFEPFYSHDWRFGPICFHSYEPLLFLAMRNEASRVHIVYALCLRDCTLRTVASSRLFLDVLRPEMQLAFDGHCAIPRRMQCTRLSGDLVLTLGDSTGDRNLLLHLCLSPEWRSDCGTLSRPIMSPVSLPFESYLQETDPLLHSHILAPKVGHVNGAQSSGSISSASAVQNDWLPIIICLKPSLTLPNPSSRELVSGAASGPLSLSLDVFRLNLSNILTPPAKSGNADPSESSAPGSGDFPSIFLGSIDLSPKFKDKAGAESASSLWLPLDSSAHLNEKSEEDALNSGLFCPSSVHVNADARSDVSGKYGGEFWYGIVRGSVAEETIDRHQLKCVPAVCLLRYRCDLLQSQITGFRDAAFWCGPSLIVAACSSKLDSPAAEAALSGTVTNVTAMTLLGLAASGRKIVRVQLAATANQAAGVIIDTWETTTSFVRLWTAPLGALNVVVYVSAAAISDVQSIFVTAPGAAFDAANMPGVQLLSDEIVLDVIWQPWASSFEALQRERHPTNEGNPKAVCQLLGVLTTRRVLILARDRRGLNIINSYSYRSLRQKKNYSNRGSSKMTEHVTSIQWIGMCLAYSTESGGVEYLPCVAISHPRTQMQHAIHLMQRRSLGFGNIATNRRLCTLPRGHFDGGSTKLIAITPNRLIYSSNVCSPATGKVGVNISSRPCIPVEAIMSGLLAVKDSLHVLENQTRSEGSAGLNLTPPASPISAPGKLISVKTKDNTAIHAMWRSRAAYVRKCCEKALHSFAFAYFPLRSTAGHDEVTTGASPSSHSSRALCFDFLDLAPGDSCRPLAALMAGAFSAADAPLGDFPYMRWLPPAFKFDVALAAGLPSRALLDLLGPRAELQEALLDRSAYVELPHPRTAHALQMRASSRVLAHAGFALAAAQVADLAGDDSFLVKALIAQGPAARAEPYACVLKDAQHVDKWLPFALSGGGRFVFYAAGTISIKEVGGGSRRSSAFDFSELFCDKSSEIMYTGVERRNALQAVQREHFAARGSCCDVSPSVRLGHLAMDVLEEYMSPRATLDALLLPAGAGGGTGIGGVSSMAEGLASDDPKTPSDGVLPNGSAKPDTWVDSVGEGRECDKLSLYSRFSDMAHAGSELFRSSGTPGARAVFVDLSLFQGHLEAFAASPGDLWVALSNSPIDQGDAHERTKALCDVTVCSGAGSNGSAGFSHGLRVLVQRGTQLDVGMYHRSGPRSCLTVEITVCCSSATLPANNCLLRREQGLPGPSQSPQPELWSLNIDSLGHVVWRSGGKELRSPEPLPGIFPPTGEDVPSGATGSWAHIAFVLDSSADAAGLSGSVALFVNGARVAKSRSGFFTFIERSEAELRDTTLYVAPDLAAGWRFTELRCWAEARSALDLERHRDSMLSMASKRKRLQLRIRGGKKLFSPLDESSWLLRDASPHVVKPAIINDGSNTASAVSGGNGADGTEAEDEDVSVTIKAAAPLRGTTPVKSLIASAPRALLALPRENPNAGAGGIAAPRTGIGPAPAPAPAAGVGGIAAPLRRAPGTGTGTAGLLSKPRVGALNPPSSRVSGSAVISPAITDVTSSTGM